tara:strand:+ start:3182 stop:4078 length:897 start_codon:yes stop_codon:yes gene_type:complete
MAIKYSIKKRKKPKKKVKKSATQSQTQKQSVIINIADKVIKRRRRPKQARQLNPISLYPPTPQLVYQPPPLQPQQVTLGDLRNVISQFTNEFKTTLNVTQDVIKPENVPHGVTHQTETEAPRVTLTTEEERMPVAFVDPRIDQAIQNINTAIGRIDEIGETSSSSSVDLEMYRPQLQDIERGFLNDTSTIGTERIIELSELNQLDPIIQNRPSQLQEIGGFDTMPEIEQVAEETSVITEIPEVIERPDAVTTTELIKKYNENDKSVKKIELQKELKKYNLSTTGNKQDLVERLVKKIS